MPDQVHDLNGTTTLARRYVDIVHRAGAAEGALSGDAPPRDVALALTDVVLACNTAAEAVEHRGGLMPALRTWADQLQQLARPFAAEVEGGPDRGRARLALREVDKLARRLLGDG